MKTEPNEPISPIIEDNNYEGQLIREARFSGLTKREYFAAMAMQGLLANYKPADFSGGMNQLQDQIPFTAVEMADLLIIALNKTLTP